MTFQTQSKKRYASNTDFYLTQRQFVFETLLSMANTTATLMKTWHDHEQICSLGLEHSNTPPVQTATIKVSVIIAVRNFA